MHDAELETDLKGHFSSELLYFHAAHVAHLVDYEEHRRMLHIPRLMAENGKRLTAYLRSQTEVPTSHAATGLRSVGAHTSGPRTPEPSS